MSPFEEKIKKQAFQVGYRMVKGQKEIVAVVELEDVLKAYAEEIKKFQISNEFGVVISHTDVLGGKDCKGKIVDMGFWFDIPLIVKKTLKVLKENGASGVRLVLDADMLDWILKNEERK